MSSFLRLVFCGTPSFAVPTLERLVEAGFHIDLVVTQPDRPKGRGLELVSSPVKHCAHRLDCRSPSLRASRRTTRSARSSRPSIPKQSSSSVTAGSFRNGCSTFLLSATSTCTLRFCRNIAAPHPFSGQLREAKP